MPSDNGIDDAIAKLMEQDSTPKAKRERRKAEAARKRAGSPGGSSASMLEGNRKYVTIGAAVLVAAFIFGAIVGP